METAIAYIIISVIWALYSSYNTTPDTNYVDLVYGVAAGVLLTLGTIGDK